MTSPIKPIPKHTLQIASLIVVGILCGWFITNQLEKNAALPPSINKNITPEAVQPPKMASPTAVLINKKINTLKDKLTTRSAKALPSLSLSGILIANDGNLAIINEQIVEVGDTINGGKIVEISPTQVIIVFDGNNMITLKNQQL